MNTKKVGKITLALTLISLGVIMLFRNSIDVLKLLELYIPIVLVVLGLEILVSKLYYERREYQVKADVGSIIITMLIVLVIGGILASVRIIGGNMFNIDIPNIDIINEIRYKNSGEIQGELEFDATPNLNLETDYSDVEILRGDGEKVKIEGLVEYRYNSESNSNLKLDDILQVDSSGDTISISYKKREVESLREIGIDKVSYRVYIPEKLENSDLKLSYSIATMNDIETDKSKIKTNYSDIYMSNINGDVAINSNYGRLDIENAEGIYGVDTNYTELDVSSLKGKLTVSANYGDIDIENIRDSVTANLNYSDLNVSNSEVLAEGLKIKGSYSDLDIDIPFEQEGIYDISVKTGSIDMGKFENRDELNVSNSRVSGKVGEREIPIDIELRMGDVEFE